MEPVDGHRTSVIEEAMPKSDSLAGRFTCDLSMIFVMLMLMLQSRLSPYESNSSSISGRGGLQQSMRFKGVLLTTLVYSGSNLFAAAQAQDLIIRAHIALNKLLTIGLDEFMSGMIRSIAKRMARLVSPEAARVSALPS
ncbi:hypothetical protein EVAR_100973_1 [Eumeta japonica]|uniref:Uncharacterized protein n=1 Tax=Eumeta variegata TaxID=151549 RepID=A0A4C2A6M9_EUMVA|nr:hypothetical protein EVAR_100973_1 [Eumeta japonica]